MASDSSELPYTLVTHSAIIILVNLLIPGKSTCFSLSEKRKERRLVLWQNISFYVSIEKRFGNVKKVELSDRKIRSGLDKEFCAFAESNHSSADRLA